ncbi:MAG: ATP-binding protein [Candidatus Saccharimonadales bacterium]|jgi:hypothetical protein
MCLNVIEQVGEQILKTVTNGSKKRAMTNQQAVSSELAKYKLLVESIEDYAIFLLDPDGYIQTWNKGAEIAKGYAADEIIGKHFSTFYVEHDIKAKKPERELELAKRYGRVEDEDWRVRKDGSHFWANVVITALFNDDRTLVGFAKVTRNVTDRKRYEDEIRRTNTVLKQQQRVLEALNTSKDEFVSLASHQLRTPATIIKQLLGVLLQGYVGELTPEHYKVVQKAYASNERQLCIVNSLLKVAQLDAGKVVLNKTETDVPRFISSIVEEQTKVASEREQSLHLEIKDSAHIDASIDQENARMAIENIIDNASKYTPIGGSIEITVDTYKEALRIAIQDTGVGIAQKDMDKLFRRFSRIQSELPHSGSGSGLGLYWANKIIELHDGTIEVKSEVGQGSTFMILMPITGEASDAQDTSSRR